MGFPNRFLDFTGVSFILSWAYGSPGPEPADVKSGTELIHKHMHIEKG